MAKKSKVQAIVPKSAEEAERLLREIGEAQRRILEANNEMERDLDRVKVATAAKVAHQKERIAERFAGLAEFADVHREELVDAPDSKTITLATGTLAWRLNPPSVTVKGEDDVIAYLEEHKMDEFLRVKPTINREAMLEKPELATTVPGVSIDQDEVFVAKPTDGTKEITMPIKVDRRIKKVA